MGLYDYNIAQTNSDLLPPSKRGFNNLSYLGVFSDKLQYLHDLFFNDYADNSTAPDWSASTTYAYLSRVRYSDNAVYEKYTVGTLMSTTPPSEDTVNWIRVLNIWLGVRKRMKFTSNKLLFEYALNMWFKTTFQQPTSYVAAPVCYLPKSDIYIDNLQLNNNIFHAGVNDAESSSVTTPNDTVDYVFNNYSFGQSCFTINVPVAVFNALGPDISTRFGAIRAFADKYVYAGIIYNITTY